MNQVGTAIILAGGKSKRMGFDKKLLVINEQRLLDTLYDTLKTRFDHIVVVSNTWEACTHDGFEVVRDELRDLGPLGGIHAGLKAARSRYSYVTACDMPNVNLDYVAFLQSKLPPPDKEVSALVTAFGLHLEPFNAFYNKSLVEHIEKFAERGKRSLTTFLRESQAAVVDEATARVYSPGWAMFANLNTPCDVLSYKKSN